MKTTQPIIIAGLAVVLGAAIMVAFNAKSRVAPAKAGGELVPAIVNSEAPDAPKASAPAEIKSSTETASIQAKVSATNAGMKPAAPTLAEPAMTVNGYELEEPMARIALNFVGSDPAADAYWIGAINDSSLPAEERKDLIEDLNEDGLSNPRRPTALDWPLILSRIRLIEQLLPGTLDQVNRDALAEAYKDLVDLASGREPQ